MLSPSHDAVERVAACSAPCRQKEAARRCVVFPIERPQQRNQLVAMRQHAVRVVGEDFAKRLITRVGNDVALYRGLFWRRQIEASGSAPAALDRRPSGIQRLVVPDLGERHIVGVRLFRSLVCLVRFGVEAFREFKPFVRRRGFHRSRPADNQSPNVRDFAPVRALLWGKRDLAPQYCAKRDDGRNGDVSSRALHSVGDIRHPWPNAVRQKARVERGDRQQARRQRLRLGPSRRRGWRGLRRG